MGRFPGSLWHLKVDSAPLTPNFSRANKGSLFLSSLIIFWVPCLSLVTLPLTLIVTFLPRTWHFFVIYQLSPSPSLLPGESSLTSSTAGLWGEVWVQGWVTNAKCHSGLYSFLVCSKTKGDFLWDTLDAEQNTEVKCGFFMPRPSCLWSQLGHRETKKAVQEVWFRLWWVAPEGVCLSTECGRHLANWFRLHTYFLSGLTFGDMRRDIWTLCS